PGSHPDLPGASTPTYEKVEGGWREEDRVFDWEKAQELRSGKVTLWDHTFELPHKHLDADKTIQESVAAGKVTHKLNVNNDKLEIYDWPGEYAQRFDGVDKGGSPPPAAGQQGVPCNKPTVEIRMQEEAAAGLVVHGGSNVRQLTSGHKFTLQRHFNGDGPYVLTAVRHNATLTGSFETGQDLSFRYQNVFNCIPAALPY